MDRHDSVPAFRGDDPAAADPNALVDRRELALVAVERTRMPMVVSDPRQPDNPIVLANRAFLDLTGYDADEVIGRNCRFLQGPDTAAEDVDAIRANLADERHHFDIELLNYRKDGTAFWNQLSVSPVHAQDGTLLYHFASQKDVTARRRAEALEATERLLLKEVDHRAMNALAIVQSIVRLSRAEDIASYSASILSRVDALARAHQLLARSSWSGADMTELVAMETLSLKPLQLGTAGSHVALPAMLVQPLTLVLQELVSNAVRHGALAGSKGRLDVGWREASGQLEVTWQETGAERDGPAPAFGFGLNMVSSIVARQLGGRFAAEWRNDGLDAMLRVPLRRGRIAEPA
jgi:PAS domain S-box-containing protein